MKKQNYALITGASSGIGREIAYLLAERGYPLIITARRVERLKEIADKLAPHPVEIIQNDLSKADGPQKLLDEVQKRKLPVEILINNAGLGYRKLFEKQKWDEISEMLQVNITSLTELSYLFVPLLKKNKESFIMQVASIAAFQPVPLMAVYGATKAYVLSLSEALNEEFKDLGITVSALCPGSTATEFFERSGQKHSDMVKAAQITATDVARIGLDAMFAKQSSVISGMTNKINSFFIKLMPRRMATRIVGHVMRKYM